MKFHRYKTFLKTIHELNQIDDFQQIDNKYQK